MRGKLWILIVPILIVAGLGLYFWRGIEWESVVSMDLVVSLETTGIQSAHAGNSTVNFQMARNSQGRLTISIVNNGTVTLEQTRLYIDNASYWLSLESGSGQVYPPITITVGVIDKNDGVSRVWTLIAPNLRGTYEIALRAISNKISCWSTIIVTVT